MRRVTAEINGRKISATIGLDDSLADLIRRDAQLTGTHVGCNFGTCGACTVILDGKIVRSCLVLALQADGARITTIEGLESASEDLHPLQKSFISHGALQCGFCTPGILMTMAQFLEECPSPTVDEVREALVGNICRCGGYQNIVNAVLEASDLIKNTA